MTVSVKQREGESLKRYAFQILNHVKEGSPVSLVASDVAALVEVAFVYCGDELAGAFGERMIRLARIARGICIQCGKEPFNLPPVICAACSERDLT